MIVAVSLLDIYTAVTYILLFFTFAIVLIFKFVSVTILLYAAEHAAHTLFPINLTKNSTMKFTSSYSKQ